MKKHQKKHQVILLNKMMDQMGAQLGQKFKYSKVDAEVDFIFNIENRIIPVEIKSGSSGRVKSLHLFLETYPHSREGIVISKNPYWKKDNLIGLPFYAPIINYPGII